MSDESWRRKTYYRPRVLIETDDVITAPDTCGLYALSSSHLLLIRNLLAYAGRRSTFVSEYGEGYYLAPTNDEWNVVSEVVAELEGILMTDCCTELVAAVEGIGASIDASTVELGLIKTATVQAVDKLDAINSQLGVIDASIGDGTAAVQAVNVTLGSSAVTLESVAAALACLCEKETQTIVNVAVAPDWHLIPDATDYFEWGNATPPTEIAAQVDAVACAMAQAWYQAGFEFMTEVVLPAMRFGFDKLIPAAAAALALWTGGVATPVAIGVYAFAELIQELLEVGYDAAEANLENWLYVHKQDIVCGVYQALLSGGSGSGIWGPIQTALVDPSGDLSNGDKVLIELTYSVVAPLAAKAAEAQGSAWYTSIQEAGYCATCPEPPIQGSDWFAVEQDDAYALWDINLGGIQAWHHTCYQLATLNRQTVGMVVERVYWNGDGDVFAREGGGCPGDYAWMDNSSGNKIEDHASIFYYKSGAFNSSEAKAQLAPTATNDTHFVGGTGASAKGYWSFFTWFGGHITLRVKYIIYSGTY